MPASSGIRNFVLDLPESDDGEPDAAVTAWREAFLDALADDFNTPRALAILSELISEGNRRALPGARAAIEEMLPLLGPRVAACAAGRGGSGGGAPALRAGGSARRARFRARGPPARRARRARLRGPRHARGARASCAAPATPADPVPGKRERERGRRLRPAPGGRGAARPPPRAPRVDDGRPPGRRAHAPRRVSRTTRGSSPRSTPIRTRTPEPCSSARCAGRRARPDPGPPQPGGGLPIG